MNVKELQRQVDRIDGFYTALSDREQSLKDDIKSLNDDIERDTKVSAVLKHILDIMVDKEIPKMAALISYGLKSVFDDQDLVFVPVKKEKAGKLNIEFKTVNGEIEGDFKSFGGSVAVIESFLMRVLCILKKDLARFMLLDESFASVGEEYIAQTGKLISELSNKINVDILLVTHQKEFKHDADRVYRVKESKNGLIMEKVK